MKKYLLAIMSVMLIAKAEEINISETAPAEENVGQIFADVKAQLEEKIASTQDQEICNCYKIILEDSGKHIDEDVLEIYQNLDTQNKQEAQRRFIELAKILCDRKERREMMEKVRNNAIEFRDFFDNHEIFGEFTYVLFSNPKFTSAYREQQEKVGLRKTLEMIKRS